MMGRQIFYGTKIIVFIAIIMAGCAPREVVREEEDDKFLRELHKYEQLFDPSEYNETFLIRPDLSDGIEPVTPNLYPADTDAPDFISGYRIQLYATSDMDTAHEIYNLANSLFVDRWIYMVYEVPQYKIRVGDFTSRREANRFLSSVIQKGFRDAWIVPDRVLKNPPEKIIPEE